MLRLGSRPALTQQNRGRELRTSPTSGRRRSTLLTWHAGLVLLACVSAEHLPEDAEHSPKLRGHQARGHEAVALQAARRHAEKSSLKIPTQWLGDGDEEDLELQNVSGVFKSVSSLRIKRRKKNARFRRKNSGQQRQVLLNNGDVQYVSHLSIGHQIVAGIIDTGSPSLVVFPRNCSSCGRAARYDPELSSDHRDGRLSTVHNYGSGVAWSEDASDLVSVGPFPETRQTFWEVAAAKMPILRRAVFEAIVGLGPPEVSAVDAWDSLHKAVRNISAHLDSGRHAPAELLDFVQDGVDVAFETSKHPNLLDNFGVGAFSICLGARPDTDGYLTWNDRSPFENPELFTRLPVFGNRTWSVRMRNMRLVFPQGDKVTLPGSAEQPGHAAPREEDLGCGAGCSALIDSGTSLLTLPASAISLLERALEGMHVDCSNLGQLPELVFEMGDKEFSLPPDAYVSAVTGMVPNYLTGFVRFRRMVVGQGAGLVSCQLLVLESAADAQYGPLWILGVPFFRKYYTAFNLGERRSERALFVASASEDCTPVSHEHACPERAMPHKRHIDPTKVHIPQTVEKAATTDFVHL